MDNIKNKPECRIANSADPQHKSQPAPTYQPPLTPLQSAPGPFQVLEASSETETSHLEHANRGELTPADAPHRKYDCVNYESCLDLAAALNWDSFTCRGCSEEVNNNLVWRAHQAKRHDAVAHSLCGHLPVIGVHSSDLDKNGSAAECTPIPPTEKIQIG